MFPLYLVEFEKKHLLVRSNHSSQLFIPLHLTFCNRYHLNFVHGVNSKTGNFYKKPMEYRLLFRALTNTKEYMIEGLCHQCYTWVYIESFHDAIFDKEQLVATVDSNNLNKYIKNYILWYKHTQKCHQ